MESDTEQRLASYIERNLTPFSFCRIAGAPRLERASVVRIWKRKTWNTNRAVGLLSWTGHDEGPGQMAQRIKMPLGKAIGYVPFFYSLGLQVIIAGAQLLDKEEGLEAYVDKVDNQRVVLQSIHIVDTGRCQASSARTWGQFVTGPFQDAIEKAIHQFLESG